MKKANNNPPLTPQQIQQQPSTSSARSVPIRKIYEKKNEISFDLPPSNSSLNLIELTKPATENSENPSKISDKENLSHLKSKTMGRRSSARDRERNIKRQASTNEKKTRWLLTRKTWRYMADAGRKLIPDGMSNKPENLAKIEDHFQKLCANEKRFLIWKRKLSYPGASGSFRRKNKTKVSKKPVTLGSPATGSSADECDDDRSTRSKRSDELIIKMLERYLSIGSDIEECESEANSSKSTIKDQNNNSNNSKTSRNLSLSNNSELIIKYDPTETLDFSKASVIDQSIWHPCNFNESMHSSLLLDSLKQYRKKNYSPYIEMENISSDLLKDKVLLRKILNDIKTQQKYAKIPRTESTRSLNISYSSSMSSLTSTISSTFHNFVDFIDNKASSCRNSFHRQTSSSTQTADSAVNDSRDFTKNAYSKMQDSFIFGSKLSSSASTSSISRTHEFYNQQKQIFANKQHQQLYEHQRQQQLRSSNTSTIKTSSTLKSVTTKTINTTTTLSSAKQQQNQRNQTAPFQTQSSPTTPTSLTTPYHTTITTTATSSSSKNNVPLIAVKTASYEKITKSGGTQTDGIPIHQLNVLLDEYKKKLVEERQQEADDADGAPDASGRSRRKSSIDNKDVSQSVSDTIKRYLNMARKKPKDNDAANRFKRVNYDRNLRNIKAKGEITKPGDDDGNMKGCQTESNWLEKLFDNSEELNRCCNSPIFSPISSPSLPSSPPSPSTSSGIGSGIIHSSTQFLSNLLWHHSNSSQQQSPIQTANEAAIAMQKSKSSSNVGHLVSKKIFRSRSKSQTRGSTTQAVLTPSTGNAKPTWTPQVSHFYSLQIFFSFLLKLVSHIWMRNRNVCGFALLLKRETS